MKSETHNEKYFRIMALPVAERPEHWSFMKPHCNTAKSEACPHGLGDGTDRKLPFQWPLRYPVDGPMAVWFIGRAIVETMVNTCDRVCHAAMFGKEA